MRARSYSLGTVLHYVPRPDDRQLTRLCLSRTRKRRSARICLSTSCAAPIVFSPAKVGRCSIDPRVGSSVSSAPMSSCQMTRVFDALARTARSCIVPHNRIPPDEHFILRLLAEASEPLFPSDITERLNYELGSGATYTVDEVAMRLKVLDQRVKQLADGRW